MGKNKEQWTPKQRQELNQTYNKAMGEYAQAMSDLGVHPLDVSRIVAALARSEKSRNNMLRFIQVAEAASQAAKKGRGNQEE